MVAKVLICSNDESWVEEVEQKVSKLNISTEKTSSGKEAELLINKDSIEQVILDYNMNDYSCFSVMKVIKTNRPSLQVYFYFDDERVLKKIGVSLEDLNNLGFEKISQKSKFEYTDLNERENSEKNKEGDLDFSEEKYESVLIESFLDGSYATIDLFVKLRSGKMIKILNRGDRFEESRIKKYLSKKQLKELYFDSSDRFEYIQKTNRVIEKLNLLEEKDLNQRVKIAQSASEKYLNEVYVNGLNEESLKEGKELCDNIYQFLNEKKNLSKLLDELEERFQSMGHSFMVAFFSIAIAKHLPWVARKSIRLLGMGAMLHDIGKLKFPEELTGKKYEELNESQKALYEAHCQDGVDILKEFSFIESSILQTVLHHHERRSGTGYPSKLTGIKIFPLAKVVGLANEFCHFLVDLNEPGKQAALKFKTQVKYEDYEKEVVEALLANFEIFSKGKEAI